jgi:hypothetical protein
VTDSPAYRHGGPGAGWYLRTMGGWRRISDTEAANKRYEDMHHFMHDPRTVTDMATDQGLIDRANAAWERHNAGPRISGGPDGHKREFIAGYYAREAELSQSDGTDEAVAAERERIRALAVKVGAHTCSGPVLGVDERVEFADLIMHDPNEDEDERPDNQ